MQEFDLQMIQVIISKEEEDEPGAIQVESINEKSEKVHIYIPPGTVHSEGPLTHLICDNFTGLASDAKMKKGRRTTLSLGMLHAPGILHLEGWRP